MIKFMAFLMFGGLFLASCSKDEEIDPTFTVDFEGEYWNKLIDNKQYGGKLIYSADAYKWTDAATTLSSEIAKADWGTYGYG